MDKCTHNVESETSLGVCLYCIPCEVEIHSVETREAHNSHHKISLDIFIKEGKNAIIKPNLGGKVGASHLTGQEIVTFNTRHAKLVEEMDPEEKIIAINEVVRKIEELKNYERHLRVGKTKDELTIEGELVEKTKAERVPKVRVISKDKQLRAKEKAAKSLGMTVEELEAALKNKNL